MNIGMLSGKGKDVPECVYEFAFPTAHSYMRPGNKPLFRGSIKNHNPRKGTETPALPLNHYGKGQIIKNHNPRKGTETVDFEYIFICFTVVIKNHNPRKGTETTFTSDSLNMEPLIIKNHNPRKGTETLSRYLS